MNVDAHLQDRLRRSATGEWIAEAAPAGSTERSNPLHVTGFTLSSFAQQHGALVAVGTLAAREIRSASVRSVVLATVALPARVVRAPLERPRLVIGPANIDVLGLGVMVNAMVLEIPTAQGIDRVQTLGLALGDAAELATLLNQILAPH